MIIETAKVPDDVVRLETAAQAAELYGTDSVPYQILQAKEAAARWEQAFVTCVDRFITNKAGHLSPRARDVLLLLARGHHPAAIAPAMGITRHTVRRHVQAVLKATGKHSVPSLLAALLASALREPRS